MTILLCLAALLLLVLSPVEGLAGVASVNGPGYTLDWWTVDGGGGSSENGAYTLVGTIGQPDAGALSGGGFQGGVAPVEYEI
jgi:hypothetical protein